MNFAQPENLYLLFFGVLTVMIVIWLIGVKLAISSTKNKYFISGKATVVADYNNISYKIASLMTSMTLTNKKSRGFSIAIVEQTTNKITFSLNICFSTAYGEIYFTPEGRNVLIEYAIDFRNLMKSLEKIIYLVCFLYCGLFIVGIPLLVWFLIIHNPDPNIRMQTFQIFQMVHGVWPPFVIAIIVSSTWKYCNSILNNLFQAASFN